jgi:hypothetical protein
MTKRALLAASLAGIVGLGALQGAVANAEETNYGSGSVDASVSAAGHEADTGTSFSAERNDDYWLYVEAGAAPVTVDGETPVESGGVRVRLQCDPEPQGPVSPFLCDAAAALDDATGH